MYSSHGAAAAGVPRQSNWRGKKTRPSAWLGCQFLAVCSYSQALRGRPGRILRAHRANRIEYLIRCLLDVFQALPQKSCITCIQGDVILSCRIRIKPDTLANNECNGLRLGFTHARCRLRTPRVTVQHLVSEFMHECRKVLAGAMPGRRMILFPQDMPLAGAIRAEYSSEMRCSRTRCSRRGKY
jgi:hypothetical protein